MALSSLRTGFLALAAFGGLSATVAQAQVQVSVPGLPSLPSTPQVVQFPGGSVVTNGSEVIVRGVSPTGSGLNVVTGSGNGIGNRVVVSGTPGALTVVSGARNGIGNQLIVNPDDLLLDVDALIASLRMKPVLPVLPLNPTVELVAPKPQPAPPSYKGKDTAFWSKKGFSEAYDCNLYWDPMTKLWFRYIADEDMYRPVPVQPEAPPAE